MKKVILAIATLLALVLAFASCGDGNDTGSGQSSQGGVTESTSDPVSSDKNDETVDSSTNSSEKDDGEEDIGSSSTVPSTDEGTDSSTDNSSTEGSEGGDKECQHRLGALIETKAPTCTEWGIKTQYCQYCDYYVERKVVPKGHQRVVDKGYDSTCSTNGLSDGAHCGECGAVIEAQTELPFNNVHLEYGFKKMINEPDIGSSGSAVFACVKCGSEKIEKLEAMTVGKIGKSDVYDILVDRENPAYDNRWYIFDGKTDTAGLWNAGSDWFGSEGDTLTVKLGCEVILTDLTLYTAGNWTTAIVTVRDSSGKVVLKSGELIANGSAYGGEAHRLAVFEGKRVKAYTIEIKIVDNKDNYMGFKVSEMEINAAKMHPQMSHTHDYREQAGTVVPATCTAGGVDEYACFCGAKKEVNTPIADHKYETVISETPVTCEVDGEVVYKCVCGKTNSVAIKHRGHIYERFKSYVTAPTLMNSGSAVYACVTCEKTAERKLAPLALDGINYLRVDKIEGGKVTLKFNIYGDPMYYEVRYSKNEITSSNFDTATKVDAVISGNEELSVVLELDVSDKNSYYVAVRPVLGENLGKIETVKVGGNDVVEISYGKGMVYHGEVLNSFEKMFDEQRLDSTPTTALARIFTDKNDTVLYGMSLSPVVDLEYMHYLSSAYLYYGADGASVTVRWSKAAVDFRAADGKWDGVYKFTAKAGWNEIKINGEARYVQVIFKDGEAPYEMVVKGYQCGSGDKVSENRRPLPTIGELMGMNGFVAGGAGYTPLESVSCTNVLREYHNVEWTYTMGAYPGQASFFSGWMGNFDSEYSRYSREGINVIPCFQWDVKNTPMSYKVDAGGNPVKSGNDFIRASFFEKFDPNTYFQYADAMFAFSARYGSNAADWLLDTVREHTKNSSKVGLNYIRWMELGNEPDGNWNGVHNYLSAYQLAALTSAGYDGHLSTVPVQSNGYHLGVKNADPRMQVAMAGIADTNGAYIKAMLYWMKANRADGSIAIDAFNVHKYLTKQITLSNGLSVSVGISPEEGNIAGQVADLVAFRDKYYSGREVWLSEFGWDTNQSYGTQTSAHAYGEYTGRQVQAMWLTRAYLLISATGVDKAMMYMCEDVGTVEEEAVGKFATAGVIGFKYDKYGNVIEFKKESYYYLYTLKNTLGEYAFNREITPYADDIKIYEYKTEDGKQAFALWCPTSDGTKYDGYKLKIDGSAATLVEAVHDDVDGVRTELELDKYGYVTVNISENPVYVIVD